jgi:predicted neuraminidase
MTIKELMFSCLALMFFKSTAAQTSWKKIKEELVFQNAPFDACHASTIVETQNGKLLLSWFGGTQEGKSDVSIWLCTLDEQNETNPRIVADGIVSDSLRFPCWNPVLFKAHTGKLFLFYKVGPNPRDWWGMVKTSDDNGLSWSAARRLPVGILGPIKNKPIQLRDGTILSPSSTEENSGRWKVHLETSANQGKTWESIQIDTAAAFDVIQPSILKYSRGRLQLLCRSKQGNVIQAWSDDNGKTWGPLSRTTLLNPNSGTDAATLKNGKQLIVYNPDLPGKDWFNGRGKLRVACSVDGKTWKDILILEDGNKEEYSYPAIIQTKDGRIHITYTYDRKNIKHVVLKEGM